MASFKSENLRNHNENMTDIAMNLRMLNNIFYL
ncbi:hypothetical protein LCGC14_0280550 [marine sediment metagenome]|uniref:Uncharacterized protein n=1 Tax=marine sediment metagenome TaxID=412755 RepID=A0A0F9UCW9_9ZZZZ